jgi:hypothetical protein
VRKFSRVWAVQRCTRTLSQLQGVLQTDQQQRRAESSPLQIRDRDTPRRARFRGTDAQCEQAFLPGFR